MSDLVTLADVNKYLGATETDTAAIARRKALITQISAAVEDWCDRSFHQATYRQWYDGNGSRYLALRQYPVTRLYQVANNTQDMGRLAYTGTAPEAFASSDGATLTLIDGDTPTDLTLSDYSTVTALKAAIEGGNWTFTITSGADNYVPTKMRPFSQYVESAGDVVDIEMPDESIDARVSDSSEWLIEGIFPQGRSNVFVWYRAGYASIPEDIKNAVIRMVVDAENMSERDNTLKSEKLGDYSYTAGDIDPQSIVNTYASELRRYKRVEFA